MAGGGVCVCICGSSCESYRMCVLVLYVGQYINGVRPISINIFFCSFVFFELLVPSVALSSAFYEKRESAADEIICMKLNDICRTKNNTISHERCILCCTHTHRYDSM